VTAEFYIESVLSNENLYYVTNTSNFDVTSESISIARKIELSNYKLLI
jgi:hypothetical protein